MQLQQVLQQCLPSVSTLSPAEIDAEICEELEFHLDMRTQDNLQAGMSPEEARKDARRRFGDFETSHRECRKISLGPRIMFPRIQIALLVALLATVIYQGMLLFRLQNDSRDRIERLTQIVEHLQASRQSEGDTAAAMPYVHYPSHEVTSPAVKTASGDIPEGWNTAGNSLSQPWCNWQSLDESEENF